MIGYSLAHLQFLEAQIAELDQAIVKKIEEARLTGSCELLRTVPGIQQTAAASILAEMGNPMEQFENEDNASSWAGVCPGNNRSAGKSKSSHTTRGNPWLRATLTECAWAAASKKGRFLHDKFWRITARKNGKKAPAMVAVAHTLLILAFRVLSRGEPYREIGAPPMDEAQRQRLIRHHTRRLGKLGVAVASSTPVPIGNPSTRRRVAASLLKR